MQKFNRFDTKKIKYRALATNGTVIMYLKGIVFVFYLSFHDYLLLHDVQLKTLLNEVDD